jgi:hypothetical protein
MGDSAYGSGGKIARESRAGRRAVARDQACFLGLFALAGVLAARFARADGVPPVLVKTLTVDRVVAANGTYTTTLRVEMLATNASAAHNIATDNRVQR